MSEHTKIIRRFDNVLTYGFFALLAGSALSGGIVSPRAITLFAIAILILALLFVVRGVITKHIELIIPNFGWPLFALILLALMQSYAWTGINGLRQSLSFNVEATRSTLFIITILLLGFLLGTNIFKATAALQKLTKFLVIFGFLYAFVSLVLYLAWKQNINWLKPTMHGSPFGSFVNRNHFAGYIELLFPLPVSLLIILRHELEQKILYVASATLMGIAVCFSLSRGGMISLTAQILLLFAFSSWQKHTLPSEAHATNKSQLTVLLSIIGLVSLIIFGLYSIGANSVILRLGDEDDRAGIWRNSLRIFQAHPFWGTGLGTFETVFPIYADDKGLDVAAESHSDYLQVLTDTGLLGALILLVFLSVYGVNARRAMQANQPLFQALALASTVSIAGLLVHSFFDFNLQLPSHALLFLLHCGLCGIIATQVRQPVAKSTQYDRPSFLAF